MADYQTTETGSRLSKIVYLVFSIAATVGIFSYLFKFVSPGQVLQLIRDADLRGILMFFVLSFTMSVFRLWRYRVLLRMSGYSPGAPALFLVVLVRNFFSDLLPARLGSLIYIYLVNSRLGVPFSAATASFSLSFVFDVIAVAPMIILAVLAAGAMEKLPPAVLIGGAVFLTVIMVVILFALPWLFGRMGAVMGTFRFLGERRCKHYAQALSGVGDEIQRAKQGGMYFRVLVLSVLARVAKYGALYAFMFALLSPLGYTLDKLPVSKVFLGTCAAELAASTPISGIAGFGIYEGTWALVFQLLGFPGQIAKVTSISHHLFTQVYGYLLGAVALMVLMLPVFKVVDSRMGGVQTGRDRSVRFYVKLLFASLIAVVLLWGVYRLPMGGEVPVKAVKADEPGQAEIQARAILADTFPGRILFDSNRSGTFGIYTMKADGSDLHPLVDTPMQEMYPDPSPDGEWVVFARGMGLGKLAPTEVWIFRREGGEERKLAEDGTFPTFSADGSTVYFERARKKVMAVGVDGKNEREVFPADNEAFKSYQVVKPRVSPDGRRVAFISDNKGRWNLWCADLRTKESRHVAGGCEAAWFISGDRLAWIRKPQPKERSGIFEFDLKSGQFKALQDADAPRGHEYFPTLTAGDDYLLWSACRPGEHDHLTSNYQLFARRLPGGEPVRLTFDGFNNRWPKLLRDAGARP